MIVDFDTFCVTDTYTLWMDGKTGLAVLNVLANVSFSLVGTALGVFLARWILPISENIAC